MSSRSLNSSFNSKIEFGKENYFKNEKLKNALLKEIGNENELIVFECVGIEELMNLGGELSRVVDRGDIIFLSGEIGAGKTTLTRGFLQKILNNDDLKINSPTYLIENTYDSSDGKYFFEQNNNESLEMLKIENDNVNNLNENILIRHIDLYRLPSNLNSFNYGLIENDKNKDLNVKNSLNFTFNPNAICLVEWPQRLDCNLIPDDRLDIYITLKNDIENINENEKVLDESRLVYFVPKNQLWKDKIDKIINHIES